MTKIMTKTKTSFLLFLTKIKTKKDSDSLDSDSSLMELDAADLHLVLLSFLYYSMIFSINQEGKVL